MKNNKKPDPIGEINCHCCNKLFHTITSCDKCCLQYIEIKYKKPSIWKFLKRCTYQFILVFIPLILVGHYFGLDYQLIGTAFFLIGAIIDFLLDFLTEKF